MDSFARFALQGLGTPAPIAPTANLVNTGLYRRVRNPMYMSVVAVIVGQAVLFGDWRLAGYGALFWVACHVFVVTYEEPRWSARSAPSTRPFEQTSRAGFRGCARGNFGDSALNYRRPPCNYELPESLSRIRRERT